MEQLVILLVIGIISLVNWLMQRSAEIREQRKAEAERLGQDPVLLQLVGLARGTDQTSLGQWLRAWHRINADLVD